MRRVVLLALIFVTALAAFLIIRLPLGVAMGVMGMDANAKGSVWGGKLVDARLNGAALGDVGIALSPLPLLRGEAQVKLRLQANTLRGEMTAFKALGGEWGAGAAALTLELGPWFAAQGISGLARLNIVEMRLGPKSCAVHGDISLGGVNYASQALPSMKAPFLCENGRVTATLTSEDKTSTLHVSLAYDGRYALAYKARGAAAFEFNYKGQMETP